MSLEVTQSFLGWSLLLNVVLLAVWLLFFLLGHDWMYRMHGRMFKISEETFDAIHYAGMAAYKIGVFLFNLVPFLVLSFAI